MLGGTYIFFLPFPRYAEGFATTYEGGAAEFAGGGAGCAG